MKALPYTLTTRPWWISHAISTPRGAVVARAEGVSTVLREPTADDLASGIAANQYDNSAECHGNYCRLMIELTEDDLVLLGVTPGTLKWPDVVDGPRPSTNRTDAPVSQAHAQHVVDLLVSEGHCDDPEPVDKTPWHKGDDNPE